MQDYIGILLGYRQYRLCYWLLGKVENLQHQVVCTHKAC